MIAAVGSAAQADDVLASPELALEIGSARPRPAVGRASTYRVTARNEGSDVASDVLLEDRIESGAAEFVSATSTRGTCRIELNVVCEIGDLGAAGSVRVDVTIRPTRAFVLAHRAIVATRERAEGSMNEAYDAFLVCSHIGTAGADRLVGTDGPDLLCGLAGNDQLYARGGHDLVDAGKGHDRVSAGSGDNNVLGGPGDDVIVGGRHFDLFRGGPGADVLNGRRGRDSLEGGRGPDSVFGGPGPDFLFGGPGRDRLFGGRGFDYLESADAWTDLVDGGPGHDMAVADARDRLVRVEEAPQGFPLPPPAGSLAGRVANPRNAE